MKPPRKPSNSTGEPSEPANRVIIGDCIDAMARLPAESVDLIFADPPYNLQLEGELRRPNHTIVNGVDDAWDQFDSFEAYDAFTRAWLNAARRVLKPDAAIWVIGSYHNIFRVGAALQDLGFWILNDIVWRKTNPMPNFRGRRFTNAHETLIWAAKSKSSRYAFHYEALKSLNDGLQMRSDWVTPVCGGAERLRDANGDKAHSTQKPEALVARALVAASAPGDLVLDPFLGSGTTAAVAKKLGRRYLGVERDPAYAAMAKARIAAAAPLDAEVLITTPSKRAAPRVPFGALIEKGWLAPGQYLFTPDAAGPRRAAKIRVDGSLVADGATGSIHQIAARLTGAGSVNGWTFWQYEESGRAQPIDLLRDRLRAEWRRDGLL